jgi:hypothetical protein
MSVTIARQGGRVQLEQSNMPLALNIMKMAQGGLWYAAKEDTQQQIKKARAEVQHAKM